MRFLTLTSLALTLGMMTLAPSAFADDDAKKKPGPAYQLDTAGTSKEIKAGATGTFSIHIRPIEGKKVHPDAPLEVKIKDAAGLVASRRKLGRKDVVEKKAYDPEVRTTLQAVSKGEHTLEASLSFFICDKDAGICERVEDKVAILVNITE